MVENDPKAEENATIKRKYKEKIFFGQFWVFLSILARCEAIFGGPKSKKFRKIFFSGIDLEWSETYFRPKISRKNFSSSFKIFKMAT